MLSRLGHRALLMPHRGNHTSSAATDPSAKKPVLRPVLCTSTKDIPELVHWALNCFTYVAPTEICLGITADDARPYYEYWIPKCVESGLTHKIVDEQGLFAGYLLAAKVRRGEKHPSTKMSPRWKVLDSMLSELDAKVWELNPKAEKLVQYHGGFIVPTYQGRTDFGKEHRSNILDYKKLKAEGFYGEFSGYTNIRLVRLVEKCGHKVLAKVDMSKHRMPDGRPVPMPAGLDAPLLLFRKF